MKKILVILFVILTGFNAIYADKWVPAREKDYFSENKMFVAHVTPAKEKEKPLLEVFKIHGAQRLPLWQCKMGNEVAPVEVYISNNGKYVASCNEWHKVGYGDYVVAFYSKKGRIKNYSMEEVLHLPKDISRRELFQLIPHSTSSRRWNQNSIKFFDTCADRLYFCMWLHLFDRWVAWDPANGKEVKVGDRMVKEWNYKGRLWALKEIEKGTDYYYTPYQFLGKLKNPDDRPLIEKLLLDDNFVEVGRRHHAVRSASPTDHPIYRLERYTYSSSKRLLADRILANWDGKHFQMRSSWMQPHYYLGKVEGIVKLPRTDEPKKGMLWIYLIPSAVAKDKWYKKPLIHRLVFDFSDYSFRNFDLEHTKEFPFGIAAVTPGEYWLKAVLDKTKPLSKKSDRVCLPQQGDYQSIESPIITVKAGQTVENIVIDCTHEVTSGAD